jgi:hypothetical protein
MFAMIIDIQRRRFRNTRKHGRVFMQQDLNNRNREINIAMLSPE